MNALETYLKDLRDIRSTGAAVAETSFYPAISNLLNEIGKSLKPKVRCVMNIANRGAGLPDGGLFTAGQFQKASDAEPKQGQPPERGVLEAKPTSESVEKIARSEQVERYCAKYGLVLVTNLRDFLLLGRGPDGKPAPMEAYRLAADEQSFWAAAAHPRKMADEHGERFAEYLKRVMLSNAPLCAPQDVAWFLASYARDAKARMELCDLPALAAVREALEESLGMKFTGERGEHFFRSTLVQTIFYGVFSAWVLWHRQRPGRTDAFNWHEAEWSLHVPFIRTLYHQVASPDRLGPLGLVEVLDWAAAALNRVDRPTFFERFQDEHAVQYFYEPFLEAFDPDLRKELGVWYTPPEIVKYQVARGRYRAPRGIGVGRRFGRSERGGARSMLRHGGLSGRGVGEDRRNAEGQGRRRAAGVRPEEGGHDAGVRLRDSARPVRRFPSATRAVAPSARRAAERKEGRAGGRVSDQLADRLGAAQGTKDEVPVSRVGGRTRRGRQDQAARPYPRDPWQSALQRLCGREPGGRAGPGGAVQGRAEQAGFRRRLGNQEVQPRRPLCPILPLGRATNRRNERQRRGVVHLQFLVSQRPVVRCHATAVPERIRLAYGSIA